MKDRQIKLAVSIVLAGCVFGLSVQAQQMAGKVEFAAKPKIEKDGAGYKISFAAAAPTDATVAILSADGKVIRHLAAGVLGAKAPEPFKPGLEQALAWDGMDDSKKPVPAGSKLRVSLGMKPEFKRILCESPQGLASRGPVGLAVDKKGILYVEEGDLWIQDLGAAGVLQVYSIKAFDGDGNYVRTLVPFRADWQTEKVSEVEFVMTKDGRRVPLTFAGGNLPYSGFTPGLPKIVRHQPVITSDGWMIFPSGELVAGKRRFIAVGTDGSSPKEKYEGPLLQPEPKSGAQMFMALSPDEKFMYYAGARSKREKGSALCQVVYRVALDGKELPKVFVGKEFEPGKAEGQFNDPRGVAVDAKGRVWVGDFMNDRIQIFDPDGKFLKSFELPGPEQIHVHPKTGAVYVLSVRDRGTTTNYGKQATWEVYEDKSVIKFASMDNWKEVARIDLPKRRRYMHDSGPMVVLDATREQPVLWMASVGHQGEEDFLWKVVDRGEKLEKVGHQVLRHKGHASASPPLAADRKNNEMYALASPAGHVKINPDTGVLTKLDLAGDAGKAALSIVGSVAVGPDGLLYVRSAKMMEKNERIWHIRRFNRKGELVPFAKTGEFIETNGKRAGTPWNEQATTFSVGPDGNLYVVGAYSREVDTGHNCRTDVYGPDGSLVRTNLLSMTKSGGCVRVDGMGRLYGSDTVRPKDRAFPDCYPADPRGHLGRWYGTVFRFDPVTGGGVAIGDAQGGFLAGGKEERLRPAAMKGMLWSFHGIGPMPLQTGCQCVMAEFDADDWGRVWVPDAQGYCVAVLDCAGNVITRFGSYGNRDATGSGGAVPEPPIPLWSPTRVAALDNDVFVADLLGCRLVQVRIGSAVSEEMAMP